MSRTHRRSDGPHRAPAAGPGRCWKEASLSGFSSIRLSAQKPSSPSPAPPPGDKLPSWLLPPWTSRAQPRPGGQFSAWGPPCPHAGPGELPPNVPPTLPQGRRHSAISGAEARPGLQPSQHQPQSEPITRLGPHLSRGKENENYGCFQEPSCHSCLQLPRAGARPPPLTHTGLPRAQDGAAVTHALLQRPEGWGASRPRPAPGNPRPGLPPGRTQNRTGGPLHTCARVCAPDKPLSAASAHSPGPCEDQGEAGSSPGGCLSPGMLTHPRHGHGPRGLALPGDIRVSWEQ